MRKSPLWAPEEGRHKGCAYGFRRPRARTNPIGAGYDFPYTGTTPPRVTRLSGEARNRMLAAPSSTFGHAAWSALGMAWRLAGVSIIDGATALTRIPSRTTSSERATVSAATAALLAV